MDKILFAEDDRNLRQMAVDYLSAKGFAVTAVENGALAVEAAAGTAFDLIVLDVRMPVTDGLTACREIRAFSDTPVLFLSALGERFAQCAGGLSELRIPKAGSSLR